MSTRLKGPLFPSFLDQRTRASRMQWRAHCGRKAQLRNLRHKCAAIVKSADPATAAAVRRIEAGVKDEPLPEYGKLHLIAAALDAADQTGESWPICANYFMDRFENMQADRTASGSAGPALEPQPPEEATA